MRLKRFELRSAHMPQRSFFVALVRGCYRTRGNLKGSLRPRYPSLKRHGELLRGPELLRARSVSNLLLARLRKPSADAEARWSGCDGVLSDLPRSEEPSRAGRGGRRAG